MVTPTVADVHRLRRKPYTLFMFQVLPFIPQECDASHIFLGRRRL